jgi:iron complex outermembrane receptor protein
MRNGPVLRRLALAAVTLCGSASAQNPSPASLPPDDLSKLSVEDLMNVEVTSASKKEQKLSRVAAAIFVITQEDILHSGALNIPDLLRMVPGLDVAQIDASTWAITSRGFNGQYSNKLLVMIDGRVVYTPTFAGVFWDMQNVPLQTIDRIEVIRGPGGTVWGANAVNGVISIFTKKVAETRGGLLEAAAGTVQQEAGTVQFGGQINAETGYRAYANYFNNDHLPSLTGANGGDGWHMLSGGFRADSALSPKDDVTFEGNLFNGREGQNAPVLPAITAPALVPVNDEVDVEGGSLQSSWNHRYSETADATLQVSFARYQRGDPREPQTRNNLDVDYQNLISAGARQEIVWGAGYHFTNDDNPGTLTIFFKPAKRALQDLNAFAQDEIALLPARLYLTAGTKLEHNDYTGFELMPSVRLAWEPTPRQTLWAAISRALRDPARSDTELFLNLGSTPGPGGVPVVFRYTGNPNFNDEALLAYEAGYRSSLGEHLSLDFAAYYNDYTHQVTTELGTPFFEATPLPAHLVQPIVVQNLMYGETHGLELSATWKLAQRWTISPGYAFEQLHMHSAAVNSAVNTSLSLEHGSPASSAQLRSRWDFRHGLAWDVSAYFVGRLSDQGVSSNDVVPSYTRLDSSLRWKLRHGFSLTLAGQNLLRDHHLEYLGTLGSVGSSEVKRGGYLKFVWTFP